MKMELYKFVRKNVRILSPDREVYTGFVTDFFNADDNDDGIESLVVRVANRLIEFNPSDIASIEEI